MFGNDNDNDNDDKHKQRRRSNSHGDDLYDKGNNTTTRNNSGTNNGNSNSNINKLSIANSSDDHTEKEVSAIAYASLVPPSLEEPFLNQQDVILLNTTNIEQNNNNNTKDIADQLLNNVIPQPTPIPTPNERMKPRGSITKQGRRGTMVTGDGKTKRKSSYSDPSLATIVDGEEQQSFLMNSRKSSSFTNIKPVLQVPLGNCCCNNDENQMLLSSSYCFRITCYLFLILIGSILIFLSMTTLKAQ